MNATSQLHRNPFFILGASARDDRRRILELADEQSLHLSEEDCRNARSVLTTPRNRLAAEIAWMPGVSPRRVSQLIETLGKTPDAVRDVKGLPVLANLNLLAAGIETASGPASSNDAAQLIMEMSGLVEALDPEVVLRDINEDRAVAGFTEVKGAAQVEAELAERRRYYRNAIRAVLDRLHSDELVAAMTEVVDRTTSGGDRHAPELVDALVDAYEVETRSILEREALNIERLVAAARNAAGGGEAAIVPLIDRIGEVATNWDRIAQPIQLSAKARGIDHEPSETVALQIRSLAIDLFNKHDLLVQSERLTKLLLKLFAEIPEVHEKLLSDDTTLSDIARRRSESSLIEPISQLCERVSDAADQYPAHADQEAARLVREGDVLLQQVQLPPTSPTRQDARDMIASTLMKCAISYGNETQRWRSCITLLEAARQRTDNSFLHQKIDENLHVVRSNSESLGDLEPIRSAPSLRTVNGIGTMLYGNTDHRADGSYMATHCFTFFLVPVFPLARYRVISAESGYRFLGKGPLRTFDKWHIAISIALIGFLLLHA